MGWKAYGLLVGYPESVRRTDSEPNRYELAVVIYAAWTQVNQIISDRQSSIKGVAYAISQAKDIARAIGMVRPELDYMNVGPEEMLQKLNTSLNQRGILFRG
ncbi:hypothetical protein BH11ARM2_BH11ARM2_31680 [soil metagenome]